MSPDTAEKRVAAMKMGLTGCRNALRTVHATHIVRLGRRTLKGAATRQMKADRALLRGWFHVVVGGATEAEVVAAVLTRMVDEAADEREFAFAPRTAADDGRATARRRCRPLAHVAGHVHDPERADILGIRIDFGAL